MKVVKYHHTYIVPHIVTNNFCFHDMDQKELERFHKVAFCLPYSGTFRLVCHSGPEIGKFRFSRLTYTHTNTKSSWDSLGKHFFKFLGV